MMKARQSLGALLGAALVANGAPCFADDAATPEPAHVTVIDFESIPRGSLPPLPGENEAPPSVAPGTQPADVTTKVVVENRVSKKPSLRHPRTRTMNVVELVSTSSDVGAMYVPSADTTDLEGDSPQRLSCGDRESVTPLRREKVTVGDDGKARLEIRDMWFDGKSCAVGPGASSIAVLQAIAWEDGKPWLFAMRTEGGVTLLMPRSNDVSAEAMVGQPVTIRGGFTRITVPLGRWGSSSIVASLPSLSLGSSSGGDDRTTEVGIELVQTMLEKSPTLLVRTRRADAGESNERE